MCVIAICNERALTDKEFENCFKSNDDGAGFAWREKGKNHYIKGLMKVEQALKLYEEMRLSSILPHVVHFRRGTAGGNIEELTHPFIVSASSPVTDLAWTGSEQLLFHNGVVTEWKDKLLNLYIAKGIKIPNGPLSDTRMMAVMVHYLGNVSLSLEGSKYVVIKEDGKIFTYGAFTLDTGIYFSNDSYKGRSAVTVYGNYNNRGGYYNSQGGWWNKEGEGYAGVWGSGKDKVDTVKEDSAKAIKKKGRLGLLNKLRK